jgi:hypothetical protein
MVGYAALKPMVRYAALTHPTDTDRSYKQVLL